MGRSIERQQAIDFELNGSYAPEDNNLVVGPDLPKDNQPKPPSPTRLVHSSITPDQDKPRALELQSLMMQAPTAGIREDFLGSQRDTAPDCYCKDCGPDSSCADPGTDNDYHLNTVRITPRFPKLSDLD